jgi:tRNA U34 2-thiouridine synthase MnmA/TrmU
LEREYWNFVFEPFVHELLKGRMGNPDIGCNVHVKFGALLEHARAKFGPETRLATGHYARLWHPDASNDPPKDALATINGHSWLIDAQNTTAMSGPLLLSAVDTTKDQSYFLSGCSSTSLCNVIFPLGNLHKKETVRQLATQLQLPTATKRDSMGICFVGKRRDGFRQFVQNYLPAPTKPVEFIDIESEQVVGTTEAPEHALLWAIGQGAKIGGSAHKYFVVRRKENCIWVCQGTKHPSLFTDSLTVEAIDWVSRALPLPLQTQKELRVQCRIRHLQPLMDGTLYCKENGSFELLLDRPVRAVAPGQMAVFYIGQVCLGGGPIASAGESYFARNEELPAFVNFASHNEVGAV